MHKEWEATGRFAQALETKVIVFQYPPSFRETPENIANIEEIPLALPSPFYRPGVGETGVTGKPHYRPQKRLATAETFQDYYKLIFTLQQLPSR